MVKKYLGFVTFLFTQKIRYKMIVDKLQIYI